jgi:DNA replication and repair protein RecF
MIGASLKEFSGLLTGPLSLVFERGGGGADENPKEDFKKSLALRREGERGARIPLVGPQRDDVRIVCGERDASQALSRGQSRKAASALVLSSAVVIERRLGRKPILIFDELTSDLDEAGRAATIESLLDTGGQVFAAVTEPIAHDRIIIHEMREGKFL